MKDACTICGQAHGTCRHSLIKGAAALSAGLAAARSAARSVAGAVGGDAPDGEGGADAETEGRRGGAPAAEIGDNHRLRALAFQLAPTVGNVPTFRPGADAGPRGRTLRAPILRTPILRAASLETGPPEAPGSAEGREDSPMEPLMEATMPNQAARVPEAPQAPPASAPAEAASGLASEPCCPSRAERPPLAAIMPAPKAEAATEPCCPSCAERPPLAAIMPALKPAPAPKPEAEAATEPCRPSRAERPLVATTPAAKPAPAPRAEAAACCAACGEAAPLAGGAESETGGGSGPSLAVLASASAMALASEAGHFLGAPEWLTIALAALAVLIGGIPTWLSGWKSVARRRLDIMALMSVAVTGAVLIGEFSEGALVLVLFALAEKLEDRSVDRARRAIASLLAMAPETAFVSVGAGGWIERAAADVPAGAMVRVRPGEKLALDGVVASGASAVNQAPITGESLPADKGPGDQVFAGTLNLSGVLEYEVSVPYGDSALARIVKTVEQAEGAKAPVERFVERFARIYTPAVFVLAVLAAVVPPLLLGGGWLSWIYRALALLVISCPCALVVSTPVALLSAMASATSKGLLVKGGVHLEEGRRLKVVAMDKTGTLTRGRPSRTDLVAWEGYDRDMADRLSASLASLSGHPLSRAVAAASAYRGDSLLALSDFADRPGLGVEASCAGRAVALGSPAMIASMGLMTDTLSAEAARLQAQGKSVAVLVDDGRVAAVAAAADTIKEDSVRAVSELRDLGVRTVMLTGDNEAAAAALAAQAGLDDYRASLLPEDKLAAVAELGKAGKVGMAGDGVNDAPALARADIGFSMGAAGSGAAIETADVAIMDDNLAKIPLFIRLSRAVHRVLVENIAFILLVKLTFIVVTLMGRTDMWMAVLADIGVTMIVVANSLRLGKK